MRTVTGGNGRYWAGVLAAAAICGTAPDRPLPPVTAQSREVLLATTTSTRDAGLLDSLVPVFERTSGYNVKVIAVGSGQALEMGRGRDAADGRREARLHHHGPGDLPGVARQGPGRATGGGGPSPVQRLSRP